MGEPEAKRTAGSRVTAAAHAERKAARQAADAARREAQAKDRKTK